MLKKKKVIFLGAVPPPLMGPTIATQIILKSKLSKEFELIHLDTSDHRDLNTLGAIDFTNIFLALKHYVVLFYLLVKNWPSLVYIPISQTTIGYMRDAIFILISKLFCRKVITHLRAGNFKNWYNSASQLTQWIVKNVHSLVDGQIVLGKTLEDLFCDILERNKIFVVPNGRNFNSYLERKSSPNKIRVLFLSNFQREKGILDVLMSVKYLDLNHEVIEFVFAGNWRDERTRQDFFKFLDKNPDLPIKLVGPTYGREKYSLLSSAEIFVFPTYYSFEGHPWVVIEAMAAGLPIITTDQGTITESVKDNINGFIVGKRNPKQIADKITYLIENPMLRKKMGEASRRLYEENFTEDRMADRLSKTFHAVLNKTE